VRGVVGVPERHKVAADGYRDQARASSR
jgi:hypothetical protein